MMTEVFIVDEDGSTCKSVLQLPREDWEAIVDALSRGFFSSNLIRDIENEILANLPNEGA